MIQKKYKYFVNHGFVKSFKRLDIGVKKKVTKKIDTFLLNPYEPKLKTHKLIGKLKDYWSFSVDYSLRIMFRFSGHETVEFIDIGSHGIYK